MLCGVDHVVEALVDLRVGEVGGEYGHDVASVRNGIGDSFVCVTCVPFVCAEGDQRGNGAIQPTETCSACG